MGVVLECWCALADWQDRLCQIIVWCSGLTWGFESLSAPCTLGETSPDALVLEWVAM